MLWILISTAPSASQDLSVRSARCPGPTSVVAERITPGATVWLLWSKAGTGAAPAPSVACRTGLAAPRLAASRVADEGGRAVFNLLPDPDDCGSLRLQLLEVSSCRVSRVADLVPDPLRTGGVLVGGFTVDQGPPWTSDPAPKSCVEACATVYGGEPWDYQCSTSDTELDGLAYVDGWGDDRFCWSPVPDTWRQGDRAECGSEGCSYSAFVDDHPCPAPNWCWTRDP